MIVTVSANEAAQYLDIGISYFRQNQFAHAIAAFDAVLRLEPDDPYAHWNRATALLSMGDYERGFKDHEYAWRLSRWSIFRKNDIERIAHIPLWQGEYDARVLAYHELGYGDAIMTMRYLPEVSRRVTLTLVTDAPLARLARGFGVEVVDAIPDELSSYDYRLPFFSVMSALQENAETIPRQPYIPANWRHVGGKLGIAWSGRTQRMFSAQTFVSLLSHSDYKLYALQPSPPLNGIESLPFDCDFADVSDRISEMDHVVSVDTAAIHLAGAMGHPSAHLILPYLSDWRWCHSARWYPTVKTYRQDAEMDWSGPFIRLNKRIVMEGGFGL